MATFFLASSHCISVFGKKSIFQSLLSPPLDTVQSSLGSSLDRDLGSVLVRLPGNKNIVRLPGNENKILREAVKKTVFF